MITSLTGYSADFDLLSAFTGRSRPCAYRRRQETGCGDLRLQNLLQNLKRVTPSKDYGILTIWGDTSSQSWQAATSLQARCDSTSGRIVCKVKYDECICHPSLFPEALTVRSLITALQHLFESLFR